MLARSAFRCTARPFAATRGPGRVVRSPPPSATARIVASATCRAARPSAAASAGFVEQRGRWRSASATDRRAAPAGPLPVDDRFGRAADPRRHRSGAPGRHRFEQHVRQRLVERRHHRHRGAGQQRRHVESQAGEQHAIGRRRDARRSCSSPCRYWQSPGAASPTTRKRTVGNRERQHRRRVEKLLEPLEAAQP